MTVACVKDKFSLFCQRRILSVLHWRLFFKAPLLLLLLARPLRLPMGSFQLFPFKFVSCFQNLVRWYPPSDWILSFFFSFLKFSSLTNQWLQDEYSGMNLRTCFSGACDPIAALMRRADDREDHTTTHLTGGCKGPMQMQKKSSSMCVMLDPH